MNELAVVDGGVEWHRLKSLVLDSVSSPITKRVYNLGLDEFFAWYGQEPHPGFAKATVAAWRVALEARGLGAVSINVRIAAVRKLAVEAADNGLLSPELANGITRVKGVASKGVRLGNWLSAKQAQALMRGYSVQAAKHVKTVASAIFTHAQQEGSYSGQNPAKFVKLPEMVRAAAHALSLEQLAGLLPILPAMPRIMVFMAAMTSMNIAEICGLRWKRVNLTVAPIIMDAELLPPFTVGVREQYYKNQWGSVKAKARRRNIPVPEWAINALTELRKRDHWTDPEDAIFAGGTGNPICENAIVQRHLKPGGRKVGMPWLSWHDLRRTFGTLADAEKISIGERKELMGHSRAEQTLQYTHTPSDQARGVLEALAGKLVKAANLDSPAKPKLVVMPKVAWQ